MLKTLHKTQSRQASWLELFFDLIFVAVIDVVTHDLEHVHGGHFSLEQLLLFPLVFIPVWWIWMTHTLYANRFDNDNVMHRLFALVIMGLMVLFSVFAEDAMGESFSHYVAVYFVIRILLAGLYARVHAQHGDQVNFAKNMALSIGVGAAISSVALFVEGDLKYWFFYAGIAVDMGLQFWLRKKTHAFPVDRKHLVERLSLLAIIILGEAIIGMVDSLTEIELWDLSVVLGALAAFVLLWAIWWIYFANIHYLEHAKRMTDANAISYAHLLFCMGLLLFSSLIEHSIKTDLTPETFRLLCLAGIGAFYVVLQLLYFVCYPPLRFSLSILSIASITVMIASTYLDGHIALLGLAVGLLVYILGVEYWVKRIDVASHMEHEHA